MHLIYCYQHNLNDKRYIGQTKNLAARHQNHLINRKSKKQNQLIDKKIKQYGIANFTLTIIENNIATQPEADAREIYWIAFYKTNICKYGADFGYNLCDGGRVRSGHKVSDETKKKIGDAQRGSKGRWWGTKLSPGTKKKISVKLSGPSNPMFGKKHDDSALEKMSSSHLGQVSGNKGKQWTLEKYLKNCKFSAPEIEEIKKLYYDKVRMEDIAKQHQCGRDTIRVLAKKLNWPKRRKTPKH